MVPEAARPGPEDEYWEYNFIFMQQLNVVNNFCEYHQNISSDWRVMKTWKPAEISKIQRFGKKGSEIYYIF